MNATEPTGERYGAAPDTSSRFDTSSRKTPGKVTIIVLTWNGLAYTKKCLETLLANTACPDYHVIVADNGSTDGTPEYVRSLPGVTFLSNGSNLGFAKGNNCAI